MPDKSMLSKLISGSRLILSSLLNSSDNKGEIFDTNSFDICQGNSLNKVFFSAVAANHAKLGIASKNDRLNESSKDSERANPNADLSSFEIRQTIPEY